MVAGRYICEERVQAIPDASTGFVMTTLKPVIALQSTLLCRGLFTFHSRYFNAVFFISLLSPLVIVTTVASHRLVLVLRCRCEEILMALVLSFLGLKILEHWRRPWNVFIERSVRGNITGTKAAALRKKATAVLQVIKQSAIEKSARKCLGFSRPLLQSGGLRLQ